MKTPEKIAKDREVRALKTSLQEKTDALIALKRELDVSHKRTTHYMNINQEIWTAMFYEKTLEEAQKRLRQVSVKPISDKALSKT